MLRRVMAIKIKDGVPPERVREFEDALRETPQRIAGVSRVWLGRNIPQPHEWTMVWDVAFDGQRGIDEYNRHPYHLERLASFYRPGPQQLVERASFVTFEPYAGETPKPGMKEFIKRTLVIGIVPGTPPERVREFEERLTQMPRYIKGIKNWAMSRNGQAKEVSAGQAKDVVWTHVWEQEYESAAGFDDYMTHPFHWGVVDLYFDRDAPVQVANRWIHVYYPCERTILGHTGGR